jgi:hypothetical protein
MAVSSSRHSESVYISAMSINKNIHGAWVVSDIIKGYRVQKTYYYTTKKEAIKLFKKESK